MNQGFLNKRVIGEKGYYSISASIDSMNWSLVGCLIKEERICIVEPLIKPSVKCSYELTQWLTVELRGLRAILGKTTKMPTGIRIARNIAVQAKQDRIHFFFRARGHLDWI